MKKVGGFLIFSKDSIEDLRKIRDGEVAALVSPIDFAYERGFSNSGKVVKKNGASSSISFAPVSGSTPFGAIGDYVWVKEPWSEDSRGGVRYFLDDNSIKCRSSAQLKIEQSRLTLKSKNIAPTSLESLFLEKNKAALTALGHKDEEGFKAWWENKFGDYDKDTMVWFMFFDVIQQNVLELPDVGVSK